MIHTDLPKFIFVHIPKTAGTSIESALCKRFLSKELRIITHADAVRYQLGHNRARNAQHLPLLGYEQRDGGLELSDYFKFTFVRNPWDLVASAIMYSRRSGDIIFNQRTFAESVQKLICSDTIFRRRQRDYTLNIGGDPAMDFIGRFEYLQGDFDKVCDRLSLPRIVLPMTVNTSRGRPHYSQLYDTTSRALVSAHFAADIEEFGYSFEFVQNVVGAEADG